MATKKTRLQKSNLGSFISSHWLAYLLIAVIAKQLLWLGIVPLWHFPDEQAHFAQVQNLAEKGFGNHLKSSDEIAISEKLLGVYRNPQGRNKFTLNPAYNIDYVDSQTGNYENLIKSLSAQFRTSSEHNLAEATSYPFLYYLLSSGTYHAAYTGDLFARVWAVRILSTFLFVLNIYVIFEIGKLLFPKKLHRYTFVSLAAFHPMFSFVGASINSDVLFNLLFTIQIWGVIKLSLAKLTKKSLAQTLAITLAATALSFVTKQQAGISLLILPLPLLFHLKNIKQNKYLKTHFKEIVIVVVLAIPLLIFAAKKGEISAALHFVRAGSANQSISIIEHFRWTILHTYREVIPWYWGVFKWLSVTLPRWVHRVQMLILLLTGISITTILAKHLNAALKTKVLKFSKLQQKTYLLFAISAIYFLALTIWDWQFRQNQGFSFGVQGRYFFPVLSAHMALIVIGFNYLVSLVPQTKLSSYLSKLLPKAHLNLEKTLNLGLIFWWIALHFIAVYTVVNSYYDLTNATALINQISQYKPWYFKGSWWIYWAGFAVISLVTFCYQTVKTTSKKNH